ncbi:MAG: DUF4412 domain-containing protein [Bacteroidetes bacterium]|nr:DUF4412 domain-containing protein [Bacteroidota bacterium]
MSSLIYIPTADAQLGKRLKERAKKAAENKVEQKLSNEVEKAAERAVEKSWNSIFGEEFGSEGDGINVSFTMNSNAVTEDAYSFDVTSTMEIETVTEDGTVEGPMIMQMHFNENELYSGTKFSGEEMEGSEGEMFMIYDLKNESMIMLMDSEDGKFSFAYDWKQAEQLAEEFSEIEEEQEETEMESGAEDEAKTVSEPDNSVDEYQFEKIGTKTIAGLECQGYKTEDDDSVMEYWVTQDEDIGIYNMLRTNEQTKHLKGNVPDDYPAGMLMEMTQENLKSGEKTIMQVTDINRNASVTYTMNDYPTMSIGNQNKE